MDGPQAPGGHWGTVAAAFVVLLMVAAGASLLTPALVPTLGILVVATALFLPPAPTAAVGVIAITLSLVLALGMNASDAVVRVANVVIAAGLAVGASLVLQRRMRRIEHLARTEAALLASVPDALFVLDPEGRLAQANAGLTRLVPGAGVGERLHPLLGHLRADGAPCPGGCPLDRGAGAVAHTVPVEGERITRAGQIVPIAYTTQPLADSESVAVAMRDVSGRVADQADRRVLLEAAARQDEQARLLRALGSPREVVPSLPGVAADVWSAGSGTDRAGSEAIDVSVLPDGRTLALVVDSPSEEGRAPRDRWKVLYAGRAHMVAGAPLGEMVTRCAELLAGSPDAPAATVTGVVLEPDTGLVQVASGGHLPPLLIGADGSTRWLEAAGDGVGSRTPGSRSVVSATLRPGDIVLLYTDQVTDWRGDVVEGLLALRSTAVALRHQPADGWARRVLTALVPTDGASTGSLATLRLSGTALANTA